MAAGEEFLSEVAEGRVLGLQSFSSSQAAHSKYMWRVRAWSRGRAEARPGAQAQCLLLPMFSRVLRPAHVSHFEFCKYSILGGLVGV